MLIYICFSVIIILLALLLFLAWLIKKNKLIGGDGGLKRKDYAYMTIQPNGTCNVNSVLENTIMSHTNSVQKYGFYFFDTNYRQYKDYTWMRYFIEIAKIANKEKQMKRMTLLQKHAKEAGIDCDREFYNVFVNSNMLNCFVNAFDMERVDYLWDMTTPNNNITTYGLTCDDIGRGRDAAATLYNPSYITPSESTTVFRWEDIGRGILAFVLDRLINNEMQTTYSSLLFGNGAFANNFNIFDGVYIATCTENNIVFSLPPPPINEPEALADVDTLPQDYIHGDVYSNYHEIRDMYIHNHNENIPCLLTYMQSKASKPINMLKIRDYVNNLALTTIIQHYHLNQYRIPREGHIIYNKYMHISWVYSLMQTGYTLNDVQINILKVVFNPNYIVSNPNFDHNENEQDEIYHYKPYIDKFVDNSTLYTRIMFSCVNDADITFWLNDTFYDHEVDERMPKYDTKTPNDRFTALFAKYEDATEIYIDWDAVDNYHFMKDIINAICKMFWYISGENIPLRLLVDYF